MGGYGNYNENTPEGDTGQAQGTPGYQGEPAPQQHYGAVGDAPQPYYGEQHPQQQYAPQYAPQPVQPAYHQGYAQAGPGQYAPPYQQGYGAQPAHQPGYGAQAISTGKYLLYELLFFIPVVNIIMMIVWSAGGEENLPRRNFARAKLIWSVIYTVLIVLIAVLALHIFALSIGYSGIGEFWRDLWILIDLMEAYKTGDISGLLEDYFGGSLDGLEDYFGGLEDFFGGDYGGLEDYFGGLEDYFGGDFGGLEDYFGALEDYFGGSLGGLEDYFSGLEDYFGGDYGDMEDYLEDYLEDFFGNFGGNFGSPTRAVA